MRKHLLVSIFTLLFCYMILPVQAQQTYTGDTWAEVEASGEGEITAVFLEEDSFAYMENGTLAGVEGDIFNHFLNWVENTRDVEIAVNWVRKTSFSDFYKTVKNSENGTFGLGSVTILDRRREEVQFTPPFINNIAVLATHDDAPELTSLDNISDDFSGMTAAVPVGTTLEGYMDDLKAEHYPSLKIETFDSQMAVLNKVLEDPDYFAYMDLSIFWPAYSEQERPIKRHPAGDLSSEEFGFIMPLSSDWQPLIEEFFDIGAGYRSSSAYRKILMKNLGTEVMQMLDLAQKRQQERR